MDIDIDMDGWMGGWMDRYRWMDGWLNGRIDTSRFSGRYVYIHVKNGVWVGKALRG
jgi:hypothetical protein